MRKTQKVVIDAEGRDHGKTFLLTELPAFQAEAWAARAVGAMVRAGLEVPDTVILSGMAAIATYGLRSLLAAPWEEVGPLLDEMMTCVRIAEPKLPEGRAITDDDIEEVSTRFRLRDEVIKLHTGFSPAAALLGAVAEAVSSSQTDASSNTKTSPTESDA